MQKNLVKYERDIGKISLTTVLFNPIHEKEQVERCMTLCLNSPLVMLSKSRGHNTDKPS